MIKNILVAIGDTDYEKNAFEYAGQLAVLLGTHLSCVFFQDSGHGGSPEVAEAILRRTEAEMLALRLFGLSCRSGCREPATDDL